jgi:hypothetical protein
MSENFNDALVAYVEAVQEKVNEHFARNLTRLVPDLIQVAGGRKYVKIVQKSDGGQGQTSVHSFVNTENGDILKAASWKTPAKHARGNIFEKINLSDRGSVPYLR